MEIQLGGKQKEIFAKHLYYLMKMWIQTMKISMYGLHNMPSVLLNSFQMFERDNSFCVTYLQNDAGDYLTYLFYQ